MREHGILAVVSGFSGAGKGTIMRELLNRYDNYALSISATTRQPRQGEIHGREYFFVTEEEFLRMIDDNKLIEYTRYVNHYYGTPSGYVLEQMAAGRDVILEIEIQGALNIKKKFPEAVLLFVAPPSAEELRRRLLGRGTEEPQVIEARLRRAVEESEGIDRYDYLLINDDLDRCVEETHQLIQAQRRKISNNMEFIRRIQNELRDI